jgi:hypothetical protein
LTFGHEQRSTQVTTFNLPFIVKPGDSFFFKLGQKSRLEIVYPLKSYT